MSKLSKIGYIVGLVIVIAVIVIIIAVGLFANNVLKAAIESAGSSALNVKVAVDEADLSIMSGQLGLKNLVIDNPAGYAHPKLLELQDGKIAVQVKSLLGDIIEIKDIKLDGVKLTLEQKGLSNNLQDLIKGMPSHAKPADKEEPSGKKLHIDNLEISNVTVLVKLLPVPGKADTVTLKLSPIKMTNLGSDNNLDLATLSGKIVLAIAGGIAEQGAGVLPDDMIKTINSSLSKAIDLGKEAGEKTLKGAEDLGKGIQEGLKGLFKKKEQE